MADGSALEAYERWIHAQGGDPSEGALPRAPVVVDAVAPVAGHVTRLGAIQVGLAALHLGAGRRTKADPIDHAVGVVCLRKRGDAVEAAEPLARIHARDESAAREAVEAVLAAYELGPEPPPVQPVVIATIR
jgi:thymidine phosphorylase